MNLIYLKTGTSTSDAVKWYFSRVLKQTSSVVSTRLSISRCFKQSKILFCIPTQRLPCNHSLFLLVPPLVSAKTPQAIKYFRSKHIPQQEKWNVHWMRSWDVQQQAASSSKGNDEGARESWGKMIPKEQLRSNTDPFRSGISNSQIRTSTGVWEKGKEIFPR